MPQTPVDLHALHTIMCLPLTAKLHVRPFNSVVWHVVRTLKISYICHWNNCRLKGRGTHFVCEYCGSTCKNGYSQVKQVPRPFSWQLFDHEQIDSCEQVRRCAWVVRTVCILRMFCACRFMFALIYADFVGIHNARPLSVLQIFADVRAKYSKTGLKKWLGYLSPIVYI